MKKAIGQYNVKFYLKAIFDKRYKSLESGNPIFDQFMTDYRTPDVVNKFILSNIDDVLSEREEQIYITSESSIEVKINQDYAEFYSDLANKTSDFTLQTIDFKKIAQAWKVYLSEGIVL